MVKTRVPNLWISFLYLWLHYPLVFLPPWPLQAVLGLHKYINQFITCVYNIYIIYIRVCISYICTFSCVCLHYCSSAQINKIQIYYVSLGNQLLVFCCFTFNLVLMGEMGTNLFPNLPASVGLMITLNDI